MDKKTIKTALISVFDKSGLEEILAALCSDGVKFVSTGGTHAFIEGLGYDCQTVESITTYPAILGGRVKTLHPKIFGGILGRRSTEADVAQMATLDIPEIDLVVVDLYPFEQTVASGASEAEIIEKIDIGGVSLIRAAAKNCRDVVVIPSKADYETLRRIAQEGKAQTTLDERRALAARAFAVTTAYDAAIASWFGTKN